MFMKRFTALKDLPIKHKLVLICMLTTASALLLASVTFIASELVSLRHSMVSNLTGLAGTIASNVTSALTFQDKKSAEEILGTLRAVSDVRMAIVYDRNGNPFAVYRPDNSNPVFSRASSRTGCLSVQFEAHRSVSLDHAGRRSGRDGLHKIRHDTLLFKGDPLYHYLLRDNGPQPFSELSPCREASAHRGRAHRGACSGDGQHFERKTTR